ncbi:disease resistance protein RGA2-like [Camellia sinensis]|nr:disease resistance protein RGA2-like [Camellia sinensis]XP_028070224.1 disease resistance protein RGA2-like [Camellia sinensis]
MQASRTHRLVGLSNDDSWTIFRQKAFARGGPQETPNLVVVGQRIVKRCGGVPLAVKTLGGLMHSKKNEHDWLSIERSEIWNSSQKINGTDIFPSLRLSFDHLPSPSLRQCFAYCSIFPKDFFIERTNLIELWMAQGYLQPTKGSDMLMEDVGNNYFDVLLWNFLLQAVPKDGYGTIVGCKMHDLVHNFALHISKNYCSTSKATEVSDISHVQHLSLVSSEEEVSLISEFGFQKLRTLFLSGILLGDVSMDKTRLRALNLVKSEMKELPSSISKMIHLRYLDISRTAIKELPSFVTNLYNLQTLRILYCLFLEKLPREFRKLVKLRHFYMDDDEKRRNLMPVGLGQLTCLLTLPFFVVGQNKGCGIEELGCLHNLRGVVKIYGLEHVKSKEGAQKANLSSNPNIQELRFHWTNDEVENTDINNDVDVLEGLKPHSNLKGLVIENYRGEKLASWMMVKDHTSLLYNLVKIELKYYKRLGEIPALGHLPFLQVLQIVGMHNVKSVGTEFYGPHNLNDGGRETSIFQALRELSLQYMPSLIEWSEAAVAAYSGSSGLVFPSLKVLNIGWCPRLIMAPSHFPSIKTLTIAEINNVALRKMSNKLTSLTFLNLRKVSGSEINFVLEEMFKNNRSLLKHVTIDSCDGVAHVPNVLHDLASLETLCIKECPNITTILDINEEHNGLTRLQDIMITKCNKLTCLPKGIGNLASLERLAVSECPNLMVIDPSDICRLTSLRSLEIKKCGILRTYNCWPEWLLSLTPDLTRLVIGDFSEELDYFPWPTITSTTTTSTCTNSSCSSSNFNITHQVQQRFFVSLKSLTLYGWSKLTSLPDQLQHLTALIDLSIWEFDGLESLPDWLGNLSSLQALHLWKCKNLMILPSMKAMRSLTKLQSLKIRWCPLLKEKCSKESGPDWHKISHIPSIQIDSNYVKLGSNHTNENER